MNLIHVNCVKMTGLLTAVFLFGCSDSSRLGKSRKLSPNSNANTTGENSRSQNSASTSDVTDNSKRSVASQSNSSEVAIDQPIAECEINDCWNELIENRANVESRNRFIQIVESNCDVEIPDKWRKRVNGLKVTKEGWCDWPNILNLPEPDEEFGVSMTKGYQILNEEKLFFISSKIRKERFKIKEYFNGDLLLDTAKYDAGLIGCYPVGTDSMVLAMHPAIPRRFPVVRISKQGKVIWTTYVGLPPDDGVYEMSGAIGSECIMKSKNGKIYLFDISVRAGIGVHCLQIEDGKRVFSFVSPPNQMFCVGRIRKLFPILSMQ